MRIELYEAEDGTCPFQKWFDGLNTQAALKIRTALARIETGNLSNVKSVAKGVLECRINFGPGYRVYFGRDGDTLVILLTGGSKSRQQKEVERAWSLWTSYKKRKKGGANHGVDPRI